MGMSTYVVGLVPPDDKWRQMKAIYDACEAASVPVPKEVWTFFNHTTPDDRGVEVNVPHNEWVEDHMQGIDVEVDKIPKHIKVLRFYNSW